MRERITVEEANGLSRKEFVSRFGSVYERSPWVAAGAWRERPFGSVGEMQRALERAMRGAPREQQLGLIRAHPDLAGKAAIAGELGRESAQEQASAGLNRLTPEEFEAFTKINRRYREKFGMPMIVCVREHTRESILRSAEERLGNSREEEIETALGEISKIARLRLEDIVEGGGKR